MSEPGASQSPERVASRRRFRATPAGIFLVIVFSLTLLARLFSRADWLLDLTTNFVVPIAAASTALAIVFLIRRRVVIAFALVLISAAHLTWLAQGRAKSAGPGAQSISVMTFNSLGMNPTPRAVLDMIIAESPDVAVIFECSDSLSSLLEQSESVRSTYPYRSVPKVTEWTIAKLSKFPMQLVENRDERFQELKFSYIYRRTHIIRTPSGSFTLAAVLPSSPRSRARWTQGNRELVADLDVARDYLIGLGHPLVIAADLNGGPASWRSTFIRDQLGLLRAKPLHVFSGTWPASNHPLLRVPIDDLLVPKSVHVRSWRTVERDTGSDHVPVVVDIVVPSDAR